MLTGPITYKRGLIPLEPEPQASKPALFGRVLAGNLAGAGYPAFQRALTILALVALGGLFGAPDHPRPERRHGAGEDAAADPVRAQAAADADVSGEAGRVERIRAVALSLVRQTRTVRVAAGLDPSLQTVVAARQTRADESPKDRHARLALPAQDPPPGQPGQARQPGQAGQAGQAAREGAPVQGPPDPSAQLAAFGVPTPKTDPGRPRIALVIDDLGLNPRRARAVAALPARLTMSFLPYGPVSAALAQDAAALGHEIMLHLPMQPHGRQDPGPQALSGDLERSEFAARVTWSFSQFEGFVGFNNHMGSRMTENADAMTRLMEAVKDRGLYFLDSLTSAKSVAYQAAQAAGLPTLVRHVFLDHTATPKAIRARLNETLVRARRQGAAIAIGHPYPETLSALRDWIPRVKDAGVDFVAVSDLLAPAARERLRMAARERSGPLPERPGG